MSELKNKNLFENDEINLYELFKTFWDSKWLILSITTASCIFIVLYSLSIPNIYRSSALVMPAQSQGSNVSGALSGLGGLASMAGLSIPSGNSNNKEEAIAVLTSHQFLEDFIINNDILLPLMASKGWDAKKNELILNPKIYDIKNKKWIGKSSSKTNAPTIQEAVRSFRQIYIVSENKKNLKVLETYGYKNKGVGAKVEFGVGVIGIVAEKKKLMRMANLGMQRSYMQAIREQVQITNKNKLQDKVELPGLKNAESQVAIPMLIDNELVGVFSVESEKMNIFDKSDEILIGILANQTASALENARLYQLEQKRLKELNKAHQELELSLIHI